MNSLAVMVTLSVAAVIIGCTSQARDSEQEIAAKSKDVSTVERRSDQISNSSAPVATNTAKPSATRAEVASLSATRAVVSAQESTTTPPPVPSATATQSATATPTTVPTAIAIPTSTAVPTAEFSVDPALAEQGIKVYQEQYCGICHQLDTAGTAGLFGPTHNGFAQTAEQRLSDLHYAGTARTAAEYVRESILNPESYVVGGYEFSNHRMPAYVNLSDTDMEALIQLLLQQ